MSVPPDSTQGSCFTLLPMEISAFRLTCSYREKIQFFFLPAFFLQEKSTVRLQTGKAQTYAQTFFYFAHSGSIKGGKVFFKPSFVNGADLLQQHNRIFGQTVPLAVKSDVGRQFRLTRAGRYGSDDYGRTVPVAYVILQNKHRPDSALFAAHHGRKVGIVNFAPLYQNGHPFKNIENA